MVEWLSLDDDDADDDDNEDDKSLVSLYEMAGWSVLFAT